MLCQFLVVFVLASWLFKASTRQKLVECPGYFVKNVEQTGTGLTADLQLAGPACNKHGTDIQNLKLHVNYDTAKRLHVKIEDNPAIAYQIPESEITFNRPSAGKSVSSEAAELRFDFTSSPFTFRVVRKVNDEVLFDSSAAPLMFQDQYLRLRTWLPRNPNLYGLGEHSDSFRLQTANYIRTLWSRDAYGIPSGTNLYGNHPIYFDHRGEKGSHGVFLLSSSGLDIKINQDNHSRQYLEYNAISGVLDLYFLAGATPTQVSQQYAEVVGLPAMIPYWSLGFHQCRFGYRDFYSIAEVIANYSTAQIPLETMWTDIDYMYERYIMTTDPDRFSLPRMRQIIDYLHNHNQHYVLMVDPAIAYQERKYDHLSYDTFLTAQQHGYFLQKNDGIYQGVVWPGVTAFPDWFHPDIQKYWDNEFLSFFDATSGIDIDGLWIDMNEAANSAYFGDDPKKTAKNRSLPPRRAPLRSQPRPIPGFPAEFQPGAAPYPPSDPSYAPPWLVEPSGSAKNKRKQVLESISSAKREMYIKASTPSLIGYPYRNFLQPPYRLCSADSHQAYGGLSNLTLDTDIVHYGGYVELDVHNLYGTMMSAVSKRAMLARRPEKRPMVITRSTFAGAGRHVGKWLGDNFSTWEHYRQSIQGMLEFAAIYQIPMVGSDVCGFGGNTTSTLCARWVTLGAFYPFMRNHNGHTSIPQELYVWPLVSDAARYALDIRYRLLDYLYSAFHKQALNGTPVLNPLFFLYPNDTQTFGIDLQFFYGDSILVSPVTEENATSVTVYLPDARFYEFDTWKLVEGRGTKVEFTSIDFTDIPLHVRGGSILPMRAKSAYTTAATRKEPFNIIVAPDRDGRAHGFLYIDDGISINQPNTSEITFSFEKGILNIDGIFDYRSEDPRVAVVTVLDTDRPPSEPLWRKGIDSGSSCDESWNSESTPGSQDAWNRIDDSQWSYDTVIRVTTLNLDQPLEGPVTIKVC